MLRAIERGWLPSDGIPPEVAEIASGLNKGLPATEAEIAEAEERRALLVEQLPSEEEIAAATKRAEVLADTAAAKVRAVKEAWVEFLSGLEATERLATDLVKARAEARTPLYELADLVREMGLDVTVPREFRPTTEESKLAGILGQLCRDVGYSLEIDRILAAEVASAGRSVEQQSQVAA